MMGNKLYVTKLVSDKYKLFTNNTVVAQVEISRAAMKAAQDSKAAKELLQRKENNIFIIFKSISCKTGAFFYLNSFPSVFLIRRTATFHISCRCNFNLFCPSNKQKGFSLLSGLFYNVPSKNFSLLH
jgi:hypothetical protein